MKFCKHCGNQLSDDVAFCNKCGNAVGEATPAANNVVIINNKPSGSVPAFVLGLIGAIFGLFGGICITACYDFGGQGGAPLLLMVGGSIVGLIGACLCFKKVKVGSALEILAAVMIAICVFFITGSDIMSLVGMILLLVGGIVGLLTGKK